MEPAADSHSIPRYPSANRSDSSHGQTGRPTVYLYTKYNGEQKVCMSIWTFLAAFKRHLIAMERTPLAYRWMLWSDVEQDLIDHLDSHPYDQRWPCDLGWAASGTVQIDIKERGTEERSSRWVPGRYQ